MTTQNLGLGKMVMYALSVTLHVPFAQFTKAATQNGVPLHLLPLPQSPVGAFKRSCTKVREDTKFLPEPINVKDIESNIPNVTIRTFEKRLVSSDEDVAKMVAGQEYEPTYKPIVTIMYNRKTLDMTYTAYEEEGKDIFCRVMENYNAICGNANIQQFRQTIQNAFRQYGSIKLMRSGNADFIPAKYFKEWSNFAKFFKSFDGVVLQEFTMSDDADNRENLRQSLLDNVSDSVEAEVKKLGKAQGSSSLAELITEFGNALSQKQSSDKKLGNAALETMLMRYRTVMEKVNLYKELLETDMSVVDSQIAIAQEQIVKLMQDAAQQLQSCPPWGHGKQQLNLTA